MRDTRVPESALATGLADRGVGIPTGEGIEPMLLNLSRFIGQ
jgi:hypothetical protein